MSIDNSIIYAKFKDGWRILEAQWADNLTFFKEWTLGYYETIRQYFSDTPSLWHDVDIDKEIQKLYDSIEYLENWSFFVWDFSKLDFDVLQPQLDKLIYKDDLLKLGFKESDEDKDELIIRYNEHSNRDDEIELIALADRFEYQWKEYEVFYDFYFSNNLDQTLNIQNLQDIKDFLRIFWNWNE